MKRIRALERELARKEKALAEAAALLLLKKTPGAGGGRGRRHRRDARAVIVAGITEAQQSGARIDVACQLVGVSARTIQRWKRRPDGDDQRCGPRHRPGNALTTREETQVLAVMTSAEYGHLSPKQLVPRLADEGRYLASESTMYRLKRRVGLGAHRPALRLTEATRATTLHRAERANQVWSWDITYLPTVICGRFLRLYLVIDVWNELLPMCPERTTGNWLLRPDSNQQPSG
jgi:transposase